MILPASLSLLALPVALAATTYPPTSDDFPNPERGFYIAKGYDPENSPQPLNPAQLRRARNKGMTLMHKDWLLSEFRDRPLSSAMLDRIRADLAAARDSGLKVIGRFLYNSGPEDARDSTATLFVDENQVAQGHIPRTVIGPVLPR
jgi:hypothetical protein